MCDGQLPMRVDGMLGETGGKTAVKRAVGSWQLGPERQKKM